MIDELRLTNKIVSFLATALVVAFTAWAGVVWTTGERILHLLHDVRSELAAYRTEHKLHVEEPWHYGIQEHVVESEQTMSVTRSRLERLERDHQNLINRNLYNER